MEQDLRQSEEKYRTLVDHALVGIGIHQDGRIVFANKELADMLGYTLEEGIGSSIADRIHPDERDFIMARAQRRQMGFTSEPDTYEIRLLKKDGSTIYALISNTVIEYNGRVATLITIADVTDSKARKELEQANKELEAFSYSVSHDLRAPLRSIDGFSQALLEDYEDKLEAEGKDYLRRVRSGSQRMSQLIDDLLNLSRITRAEMRYEKVNLSTLAEAIAAELQETQPDRQVEFIIGKDITAHGDSHLLRVVLENLLSNAWKFTSKHPRARIEFGATQNEGKQIYFVRDNGAGFDMAYVDKLFVPFQRLHTETEFPGIGIGLATGQRIIRRHGGTVWAEGEVEKGATFYFTLQS
jgi:PAS domain S-box-containing protein